MLKLHDIFLRKFILLFALIFIIMGGVFYFWIKNLFIEQIKIDLLHNIDIVSLQLTTSSNFDRVTSRIKEQTGLRVTIIDGKGNVLGESDKGKSKMDNHRNRKEVVESIYREYGFSIRHSDTVGKDLLYVSKKFIMEGKDYYIRMARDTEGVDREFFSVSVKVAILFIFFMLLSFWMTLNISKKIEGETATILGFLHNLTKRKKAAKIESMYSYEFNEIMKILTKVSETLAKNDKKKTKYTAKLKLANRQKDDIISAISHEFKNPIAVISGYTQTLIDDKEINLKIRDKFLNKIASNSVKLTDMIDRLRLTIKLEEGKQPLTFTRCSVNRIIKGVIDDLNASYPSRNLTVNDKELEIEADDTLITMALTNLIENALKYSTEDVEIRIEEDSLSVIDKGLGISKKEIPKITQKFYRVSKHGWNNSLGIGLSLVANILFIHHFKLDVQSVENEGSKFTIIFNEKN